MISRRTTIHRVLSHASRAMWACSLGLCLVLVPGCGTDSDPAPPAPDTGALIATPDALASLFQAGYETMDAAAFADLLDTSYVMPLQPYAAASYPDLGLALELGEVLRIHDRLFAGQVVTDPNQQSVPAVETIDFTVFAKQGSWVAADPDGTYPGTVSAFYDVEILMDRGPSRQMLIVQGAVRMHVAQRDTVVGGLTKPYCRLRAITDLTIESGAAAATDKAIETVSLGRLLGLWR